MENPDQQSNLIRHHEPDVPLKYLRKRGYSELLCIIKFNVRKLRFYCVNIILNECTDDRINITFRMIVWIEFGFKVKCIGIIFVLRSKSHLQTVMVKKEEQNKTTIIKSVVRDHSLKHSITTDQNLDYCT